MVFVRTTPTLTDLYFPLFEIIYSIEIIFILIFYALSPIAFYVLWNARPFHRNLRLSFCNLVVQGLLGATSRLIFLYNEYTGDGPLEERPSVIVAAILRTIMIEIFVGLFIIFAVERSIATFAWSWYEKATLSTIIVFILLEGCALLWSWALAVAFVFEYIGSTGFLIYFAICGTLGLVIGLFVVAVNYRAWINIKAGTHVNGYSVARTFQIRENVVILKALFKIGVSMMLLNVPLFVLAVCQLFLSNVAERMISRALFDLIIAIYPTMIITFVPLSDAIFEKSLKRMPGGIRLFRVFSMLHCRRTKEPKEIVVVNETDRYFRMLATSSNVNGAYRDYAMVYAILHTNRTFTNEYSPFFEIVNAVEITFILIFYALAPICFYMLWNARLFHRNLRLTLCNIELQGLIGTTARLIILYNYYTGDGPLETRPSMVIGSLMRTAMLESFVGMFFFVAIERVVATFAWSWYEKAAPRTLIVFFVLEGCAVLYAWAWSYALIFEYISIPQIMLGIASTGIVGGTVWIVLLAVNFRAHNQIRAGARINQYSVAKTFQIRENVVILKALVKMGSRIVGLTVPLFILAFGHLILFEDRPATRVMVHALFDLVISIYPALIITYIPLSDAIFERSLKKLSFGDRLFRIFSLLHCSSPKEPEDNVIMNETEHYFSILAASWNRPITR